MNCNVSSGLQVITMCQQRFIICNSILLWWGYWKPRKLCMCGERGCMINPCIFLSILLLILKIALKIKSVFFFKVGSWLFWVLLSSYVSSSLLICWESLLFHILTNPLLGFPTEERKQKYWKSTNLRVQ